MTKRLLGVLIFAAAISLVASAVVYRLMAARMTASASVPVTQAVVATRDIAAGYLVKADDIRLVEWKGQLPKQAIAAIDQAEGRGAIVTIRMGDLVTENQLAGKGAGAGLAVKIPSGMRAVAVKVNDVVGLAGFVLPGMRVDIIACGTPPGNSKDTLGTQSRIVLQNIEVLSAGQNIQQDNDGKPIAVQVVNLLVTPEQSEVMSLAANETKIQLVLRNPSDGEITKTEGSATVDLFNARKRVTPVVRHAVTPVAKAVAMERVAVPVTMEVISGAKKQDTKVGETFEDRPKEEKRK